MRESGSNVTRENLRNCGVEAERMKPPLCQAIPSAYSEFIGRQIIESLRRPVN